MKYINKLFVFIAYIIAIPIIILISILLIAFYSVYLLIFKSFFLLKSQATNDIQIFYKRLKALIKK